MFTPIHLLPRFDPEKLDSYQKRWETDQGPALRDKILEKIREGAGEDFLQWDFENGKLGFLESQWDLKGINIFKEEPNFPTDGSGWFEATDFSYSQFYHSKFRDAVFSADFSFARIYNCEFVDCTFSFSGFYGATLEKVKFINCDFVERNGFTNCDFREVEVKNCFMPENIFIDCRFDASTRVDDPIDKPRLMKLTFDKKGLAEIFQGIKDAYTAGGVVKQARTYFFRQMQAITRYNAAGLRDSLSGYLFEYVAGYGVRPLRVLITLFVLLVLGVAIFSPQVGFHNALILTAGGFFTFGGYIDLLRSLCIWYQLWYIFTAFLGMILTGLYVTVWANVWLRER